MQSILNRAQPVQLVLDTDMLTDCDDLAALGMLHTLESMGEARLLAVTVSSREPRSAPVVDAVNTYYGRPDIPVGAPKNGRGAYRPDSCFLEPVAAEFPHRLRSNEDAPDAVTLLRRVLWENTCVVLLTIGYLTNVAGLLQSGPDDVCPLSGMELVERSVTEWVCMGGNFPVDDASDNVNFTRDPEPAIYALQHYPGRMTFVGREIGHQIFAGNGLKQTPRENPVRRGYELHRGRYGDDWNHHTADPSTVLYAVRGCRDYFTVQPGRMLLEADCSFRWDAGQSSNQSYLVQRIDRGQMGALLERLICAPPGKPAGEADGGR